MPTSINVWEDFNYESLKKTCKGRFADLLQLQVQPLDFSRHFEDSTEFTAEHSLECFFHKWTRTIVSFALSAAQSQCKLFEKPYIRMIQGCDAANEGIHDTKKSLKSLQEKRLLPDWAGVYSIAFKDGERPANILPGDTKLSHKWKSRDIEPGIVHKNDDVPQWLWPIMQVFTYCIKANSRYGYIITDKEIVVLRVRQAASTQESFDSGSLFEDYGAVEYACIDYDNTQSIHSGGRLTLNMALWWLHLLAAKDRSIQQTYQPLEKEYLPVGYGRRDSLFRSEIELDRVSVDGTERSSSTPPDLPENSFQVSQGPGSSFEHFSETETSIEDRDSTRVRRYSTRTQDETRKSYPGSNKRNQALEDKRNKKRKTDK
jgi:hypothetical protein